MVYVRPSGDLLTPAARFSFMTLPNVFLEKLAGGNVSYYRDRRNSVGLTAYGAEESNLVKGIDLDFQEWSRHPSGRKFGAAGGELLVRPRLARHLRRGRLSFDNAPKFEPAFDRSPAAAAAPPAIVRDHRDPQERGARDRRPLLSKDYENPYARPISQPDEFDGQRARDEAGVRVRYVKHGQAIYVLRALADVWVQPSHRGRQCSRSSTPMSARTCGPPTLWLGLWERYQDKDLDRGGHDQCFEVSTDTNENGEPIPCGGRQLTTIVRASYAPDPTLDATRDARAPAARRQHEDAVPRPSSARTSRRG